MDMSLIFNYFFTAGAAVGMGIVTGGGMVWLMYRGIKYFVARKLARGEE